MSTKALARHRFPALSEDTSLRQYSNELIEKFFAKLELVPSVRGAAAHAGTTDKTIRKWGRQCPELAEQIKQALAKHEYTYAGTVHSQASEDTPEGAKWASWQLSKMNPQLYGDPRHALEIPPGADPEQYYESLVKMLEQPGPLMLRALAAAGWVAS